MGQKLGQHFLKNHNILSALVSLLDPEEATPVIEIGPGHGELTQHLLSSGAHVAAIEKDEAMIEHLNTNFEKEIQQGQLTLIHQDVLSALPEVVASYTGPYDIAGNIPYYITGYILRTIGDISHKPRHTLLVMQKEVAERACATKGKMNLLAASIQVWATPRIVKHISRKSFSPPPKVDSAALLLEATQENSITANTQKIYYTFIRTLFSHPRKNILNNLSLLFEKREVVRETIEQCGLSTTLRPQHLSIDEIKKLFASFHNSNILY
jgi:16S rRNA (adenine1518-N6/adenine1519-N6)-dimethyltransferase